MVMVGLVVGCVDVCVGGGWISRKTYSAHPRRGINSEDIPIFRRRKPMGYITPMGGIYGRFTCGA